MLDRQLEQQAQPLEDLLGRHAFVGPVGRELEALTAVDERVAGDERPAALDPEHEVVRLHPREGLDADRQPLAGPEHLSLDRARVALVGRGHVERRAETLRQALGVAPVPRARQHDRRLAAGCELVDLARWGQRVEQQQTLAVVDRVGRDHLVPLLSRLPVRVRCLPVPQARLQLAHGGMLNAWTQSTRSSNGEAPLDIAEAPMTPRPELIAPGVATAVFGQAASSGCLTWTRASR